MSSEWITTEVALEMLVSTGLGVSAACKMLKDGCTSGEIRARGFYTQERSGCPATSFQERVSIERQLWLQIADVDESGSGRHIQDDRQAFSVWRRGWFKLLRLADGNASLEEADRVVLDRFAIEALLCGLNNQEPKTDDMADLSSEEPMVVESAIADVDRLRREHLVQLGAINSGHADITAAHAKLQSATSTKTRMPEGQFRDIWNENGWNDTRRFTVGRVQKLLAEKFPEYHVTRDRIEKGPIDMPAVRLRGRPKAR